MTKSINSELESRMQMWITPSVVVAIASVHRENSRQTKMQIFIPIEFENVANQKIELHTDPTGE